jgi:drug/metabolite transporter (DMT)-like permease
MTKYIFMVFVGACSYGILSTFVKLAYHDGYTAEEITVAQTVIGMLALWVLVLFNGKDKSRSFTQVSWSGWLSLLFTGACIGFTSFIYYLSVKYIPASIAIVILMQFTWMGVLLDWLIFKKKPSGNQLIVIVVILAATVLASGFFNVGMQKVSPRGVLYAFASTLLYAVFVIANGRLKVNVKPLTQSAIMMLGAATGIVIVTAHSISINHHFDLHLLAWGAFLALFGTIIPPVLFAIGIPKIGSGNSAIIMTAELPVAILCSHFVLGEKIDPLQWLGVAVMLFAIIWMKRNTTH